MTGLPTDATHDEIIERFSKCGLIEEDYEGEPKVKMYARDDGTFSGEALVVYFKEESVMLALSILDDAELRLGDPGTRMSVQQAEFGHKGSTKGNGEGQEGGEKPRKTIDKKAATRRIGKMQKYVQLVSFIADRANRNTESSANGTMRMASVLASQKRTSSKQTSSQVGW